MPKTWETFAPGMRVRLVRDVERYPYFLAKAGSMGTVETWSRTLCAVKMDEPLGDSKDARAINQEEWDNCIHWCPLQVPENDPVADLELVEYSADRLKALRHNVLKLVKEAETRYELGGEEDRETGSLMPGIVDMTKLVQDVEAEFDTAGIVSDEEENEL